jgi:hypothetical protein
METMSPSYIIQTARSGQKLAKIAARLKRLNPLVEQTALYHQIVFGKDSAHALWTSSRRNVDTTLKAVLSQTKLSMPRAPAIFI